MRILPRAGIISLALSFVMLGGSSVVLSSTAMAVEGQDSSHSTTPDTIADRKDDFKPTATAKLAEAKLKICQQREKGITNAMSRIAARGQKHLNLISDVANKAESFYTKQGHTLSNYDALVTDVNAKKALAQTAVDNVKNSSGEFKCTGDNPKGAATDFAAKVKTMNTALKDYKTSVKTLIKGIKSVQPPKELPKRSDQQ